MKPFGMQVKGNVHARRKTDGTKGNETFRQSFSGKNVPLEAGPRVLGGSPASACCQWMRWNEGRRLKPLSTRLLKTGGRRPVLRTQEEIMLRKIAAGLVLFGVCLLSLNASGAEMKPFLYTQDFEESDPVEFSGGKKHTVNYTGITGEKAFSGKKSYKIDIILDEGGYAYWHIPIRVPAEGKIKFSGRILVGGETTARAALGANINFHPTGHSATGPFGKPATTMNEWTLVEADIVNFAMVAAENVTKQLVWEARGENVGSYMERISFLFTGAAGTKAVVYFDDIKIEGEVPSEESYKEMVKKRWAPVKEKSEEKISSWEKMLAEREKETTSLANLSPEAEAVKKKSEEKISGDKNKLARIKRKGFILNSELKEMDILYEELSKK